MIALLGIAGCMQLGRGWGARIAALGFLAQAAWIVPHAPGALPIAALAVTAIGLSVAANVGARERLGAACVAVVPLIALVDTSVAMTWLVRAALIAACTVKLWWSARACERAAISAPIDAHRAIAWRRTHPVRLRCAVGVAYGGVMLGGLCRRARPRTTCSRSRFFALFGLTAVPPFALLQVRALQLAVHVAPTRDGRRRCPSRGARSSWAGISPCRCYVELYLHGSRLGPVRAVLHAAVAGRHRHHARDVRDRGADAGPAATKRRGVAVVGGGGRTAIAVGLEWLSFQAATEGLAVPLMLVVAGALHLLASGLVADATGAIGCTFVPADPPVATAMAT